MTTAPPLTQPARHEGDGVTLSLLAEDAQPASQPAEWLAAFIDDARVSLEIAIYDCRLTDDAARIVRDALQRRVRAGVAVRLIYDRGDVKPQTSQDLEGTGVDLAPAETHEQVAELGLPDASLRAAHGFSALMHHKYVVRDREAVWTGSMNWTNDSMSRMENIVVAIQSPGLAQLYARDFAQLWRRGRIEDSGDFRTDPVALLYAGRPAPVDVDFSPGMGNSINAWVAARILSANRRVVICSMLLNSSEVLRALMQQLDRGRVQMWGVYDETQMQGVLEQWRREHRFDWKVEAVERVIADAGLVGKRSIPYRPGQSHNFMHNKTLVLDDLLVTGSYNLSHSAQENAENVLAIDSPMLAEAVTGYVDELRRRLALPS